MMTVLGIDTATNVCSAAIVQNGNVIAKRSERAPQRHAELLLPFIQDVIKDAHIAAKNLDRVAVSNGPGSFTGLRIGLSVAKGIAAGVNIPVIPVPTMDCIAYRTFKLMKSAHSVLVILPARRNEYYCAGYKRSEEKPEMISGIDVYATDGLAALLVEKRPDAIAGEGVERLKDELHSTMNDAGLIREMAERSIAGKLHFNDAAITAIISNYYDAADTAALEPMYIKDFESGSPKFKQQLQRPE